MVGIYKITNKINQKSYIGQSVNIESRWLTHKHDSHNIELKQDIESLGLCNFTFEVLEECEANELDIKEKYWIAYFDSFYNGYNKTLGGSGDSNPLGLDYEAIYQSYLETNSMQKTADIFNCSITPVRNAIRQHGIDMSDCSKEKKVEQIDINTLEVIATYSSLAEAGRAVGLTYSAISRVVNGHGTSAAGYYWRLAGTENHLIKKEVKKWKRPIAQCDLETEKILNTFSSASDAARFLGKHPKNGSSPILMACKGKYKHAYGFKWKYLDE